MILLPLPFALALIFGFLALRMLLRLRPVPMLAWLLGLLALQAMVSSLAQHSGFEAARFLQPISAMIVPALAWVAWRVDGLGQRLILQDWLHALGPIAAFALRLENALLLEAMVPLSYMGYGGCLAVSLLRTGPEVPRARLGQGDGARLVWAGVAAALALSALSDIAIAALVAAQRASAIPLLIDITTTALLLGLGVLAIYAQQMTGSAGSGGAVDKTPTPQASEDDQALFQRLQDLMEERKLWRDPDVTLASLARRLHVPAKSLSIAVNRVTGQNISRFVNQCRISAAINALQNGANVTEAMLSSGFLTKSNFNREFRRITGQAPSDYSADFSSRA